MSSTNREITALSKKLEARRLGHPLTWFETVGSTNDILKELAETGAPEGCMVIADQQTQGRGRQGRNWISLKNKGVYLSLLLRPAWPTEETSLLSMLTVVAVAQGLEKAGLRQLQAKWPNDVLVCGKKISGILVEPRISRNSINFAVIGIGINLRHSRKDLDQPGVNATSCILEGCRASRATIVLNILEAMESYYSPTWQEAKDRVVEAWSLRQSEAAKKS